MNFTYVASGFLYMHYIYIYINIICQYLFTFYKYPMHTCTYNDSPKVSQPFPGRSFHLAFTSFLGCFLCTSSSNLCSRFSWKTFLLGSFSNGNGSLLHLTEFLVDVFLFLLTKGVMGGEPHNRKTTKNMFIACRKSLETFGRIWILRPKFHTNVARYHRNRDGETKGCITPWTNDICGAQVDTVGPYTHVIHLGIHS